MTKSLTNTGNMQQLAAAVQKMRSGDSDYFAYAPIAWDALGSAHREVLNQLLHQGPVADGNILSKSHRGDLIAAGLAVRCCYMGQQGYTAASYLAYTVWRAGRAQPYPVKPGAPA